MNEDLKVFLAVLVAAPVIYVLLVLVMSFWLENTMDEYLEELEAKELDWFLWSEQDHQEHVYEWIIHQLQQ